MLDQIAVSGGLSVFLLEIENVSEDLALLNLILFFFFTLVSLESHPLHLIWSQTPPDSYGLESMRSKWGEKIFRIVYIYILPCF